MSNPYFKDRVVFCVCYLFVVYTLGVTANSVDRNLIGFVSRLLEIKKWYYFLGYFFQQRRKFLFNKSCLQYTYVITNKRRWFFFDNGVWIFMWPTLWVMTAVDETLIVIYILLRQDTIPITLASCCIALTRVFFSQLFEFVLLFKNSLSFC